MGILPKIIKGARTIIHSDTLKYVTAPLKKEPALLSFAPKGEVVYKIGQSGVRQFRIKPDITMPVRPETLHFNRPAFPIQGKLLTDGNELQLGELGNISLRLADKYKKAETAAAKEIREVFEGFDVAVRAKGANSVYSKLKRMIPKLNKTVTTDEEARQIIQDAIGGRIQLKDLTQKDILETLNTIKIEGKNLTTAEKNLVQRLFKGEKLAAAEMETAQKLAKSVKIALAEKQTEPVVKQFILSNLKDALNRNITTFEKLEKAGISKDIIQELKTNPNVKPLRMTEINNYKGQNGVAYFSDRQIREFEKMQFATGEKIDIITCSENIDLSKYGIEELPKNAQDAIKASGYTTGQINVILSDGSLAEIQIRGSGQFPEYEHLAYDATLEKNTLGEIFNDFKAAMKQISKKDMPEYNKYKSDCYDYYRDLELGIIRPKPKLPEKFDKILSEESMKHLHDLNEADQAEKMKGFIPHIEADTAGTEFII